MSIFPLFSNLWRIWVAVNCEARQLQALQDKPGEHLLRDAGITRHEIAGIMRCYRLRRLLAALVR
ncbi:hypothetical protein [Phyllobacterium myrsinacearum]|uniref:Uncharacterized protein YjiS (DUF1127 family) n=1 Tax=Phyllobacterium myrsinacearum TaxID=28101 RepID=A0A839ECH4_9HYPH|nr:hypothetical protein [Phyllobacterium myrsinacearum]MBA8876652.1 uncharacterized protein YjiS (DUF1127 family) [Phyllobacterium myrsinacearum]